MLRGRTELSVGSYLFVSVLVPVFFFPCIVMTQFTTTLLTILTVNTKTPCLCSPAACHPWSLNLTYRSSASVMTPARPLHPCWRQSWPFQFSDSQDLCFGGFVLRLLSPALMVVHLWRGAHIGTRALQLNSGGNWTSMSGWGSQVSGTAEDTPRVWRLFRWTWQTSDIDPDADTDDVEQNRTGVFICYLCRYLCSLQPRFVSLPSSPWWGAGPAVGAIGWISVIPRAIAL